MSASRFLPTTAVLAALGFSAFAPSCGSSNPPVTVPGARALPWMESIGPEWQRTASKLEFGDTVVWYRGTAAGDYVEGKKGWIGRVQGQVVAETRVAGRQSLIFSEMLDFHPNDVVRSNGGVTQTTDDRLGDWIERRRAASAPPPMAEVAPVAPAALPAYRPPSATNPIMPVEEPVAPPPPPEKPAWKRWLWPF